MKYLFVVAVLLVPGLVAAAEKPLVLGELNQQANQDDSYYMPLNQDARSNQVSHGSLGNYPYPARREILEKAAASCEEEVAQVWAQQANVAPYRRAHFQKCVGRAKVRCDKLKELAESIKLADEQLYSYQQDIQNALKVFEN